MGGALRELNLKESEQLRMSSHNAALIREGLQSVRAAYWILSEKLQCSRD
jgi:hypothetical protein